VLNIVSGFLAILNASHGRIEMSAWFIILAAVFDSMDGIMARITRSSSQFGVELDSLADVVSFGAAPSFLAYQAHLHKLGEPGLIVSAVPLVFGAIRLARFNVQLIGFEKDYFKGLPIPFAAITLCAFLLQHHSEEYGLHGWTAAVFGPLVAVLGLLMVSRVRYDTLPKFTSRGVRSHPWRAIAFSVAAVIVISSGGRLFFAVLMAFVLFGVARSGYGWLRSQLRPQRETEEGTELTSIDI
jgi:CDP-diacylglycerol--serine O-phosphatidyltransferase